MRLRTPGTTAAVLVTAALVVLGGCSSDDQDGSAAGSSSSPSTRSPGSPSTSPTTIPTESESATPSVAPAVGEEVSTLSMTFTVPTGFERAGSVGNGLASSVQLNSVDTACFIIAGGIGNIDSASLDEAAQQSVASNGGERQADREVGGQQVFVVTGGDQTLTSYGIGRVVGDQVADLTVSCAKGALSVLDDAEREQLIESILATVQWKE